MSLVKSLGRFCFGVDYDFALPEMHSLNINLSTVIIYSFVLLCTSLKCDTYFLLAFLINLMKLDFTIGKPEG